MKAGKESPLYSKENGPICPTSNLKPQPQKIPDAYITDKLLCTNMSKAQHAYTEGRPTETTLHLLTLYIYSEEQVP